MKFKFSLRYFLPAILLFVTEVLIALYANDAFIRPYFGDYLVVILIYCAVRSFVQAPVLAISVAVLLFGYAIETLQYFHIVNVLGLQDNVIARTVIGTGFGWADILAYTLGVITIVLLERIFNQQKR